MGESRPGDSSGPGPGRSARPFPWVTALVCLLALAIHGLASAELDPAGGAAGPLAEQLVLLGWGAKSVPLVADAGASWRILSFHLVHTGWIHLAFNLGFLFPVGGALELACRRDDYVALLAVIAAVAGLGSLMFTPEVSAGASGLVFGLLGASTTWGVHRGTAMRAEDRRHFGLWVLPFLGLVVFTAVGNPHADHGSHFGGLAAGLALGPLLRRRDIGSASAGPSAWPLAVAAPVLACVVAPALLHGHAHARRYRVQQGLELEVPHGLQPGFSPIGTLEFRGSGGLVTLGVEGFPASAGDPVGWYRRFRLEPLVGAGLAGEATLLQTSREPDGSIRARFGFQGAATEMSRDVLFVPPGAGAGVTLSFESPAQWRDDYGETRERTFGSMAGRGGSEAPETRAAALP